LTNKDRRVVGCRRRCE